MHDTLTLTLAQAEAGQRGYRDGYYSFPHATLDHDLQQIYDNAYRDGETKRRDDVAARRAAIRANARDHRIVTGSGADIRQFDRSRRAGRRHR